MTIKEEYEKRAGEVVELDGFTGVICGYNDTNLIMAVTGGVSGMWNDGWHDILGDMIIVSNVDNELGYWIIY